MYAHSIRKPDILYRITFEGDQAVLVGHGETKLITRRTFDKNYQVVVEIPKSPTTTLDGVSVPESENKFEEILKVARGVVDSPEEMMLFLVALEESDLKTFLSLEDAKRIRDNNRQAFMENFNRLKVAIEEYDSCVQRSSPLEYISDWVRAIQKYINKMTKYYSIYLVARQGVEKLVAEEFKNEKER